MSTVDGEQISQRAWRERTRSALAPTPARIAGAVNIHPRSVPHQTCVRRALPTRTRPKQATSAPTAFAMRATRGATGALARRAWRESTKRQRDLAVAATAGAVNTHPPWALRETGLV